MSEEITPAATPAAEPTVETPASGLPSDVASQEANLEGFQLSDEFVSENFKDGKLKGRFGSVQEVLDKLKEAEDFKANTMRDKADSDKASTDKATQVQAQQATLETQQGVIMEMLPAFEANGMQLTPDMEAKAVEAGIDIRDLKIGAMELRERTQTAHGIVGGADEYKAMIDWGKDNMTDAQKAGFDKDLQSGLSEYAIKGLHNDFKQAVAQDGYQPQRIEGGSTVTGLQPYADRRELYADKDYVESAQGRRDPAAIKRYNDRKRMTPDSVLFGN